MKHLTLRELIQKLKGQEEYLDDFVYAYCCQRGFHRISGVEYFAPYNRKENEGLAIVIDEAD